MRLIDADALKAWVEEYHTSNWGIPQDELIYAIGSAPTIELRRERDWNGWEDGKGGTYLYDERVLDTQPSIGNIDSTSIINCGAKMERSD